MDVKGLSLDELQHEHPLTLIDLQLMHRDYEEDDDDYDDKDIITTQNFNCLCKRCDRRIDWYHRYYYKCSSSSCNYSIHKFCEEIPTTLQFPGHPSHALILKKTTNDQKCHGCLRYHRDSICYHCSTCKYGIDLLCATFVQQSTIHHPAHPHPLISVSVKPALSKCSACGKRHEGHFYHCTTCFNFSINSDCLSLPIKLLLQTQTFSHHHLLTISYSFLDRLYDFECRICGKIFKDEYFIYKCSKCMYYVHPDCAMQRIESLVPKILHGTGKTKKQFKNVEHPKLLHVPLFDESHILSRQLKGETSDQNISHTHPVVLIGNDTASVGTSEIKSVSLHDPMKRTKLLCTGCVRPITNTPYYRCSIYGDDCNFVLHDWCARLPKDIKKYVGHPKHTLKLVNHVSFFVPFRCHMCKLPCNGFSYRCLEKNCAYRIDVNCGYIPKEIKHEAHVDHLLTRVTATSSVSNMECRACRVSINKGDVYFRCSACDFYLDCRCSLHLPKTIRHKFDKHSLKLSYSPIEDHKSRYFCEVCEEGLDPGKWFYHCAMCAQSIHSACAPLILRSEQDVNSLYVDGVYTFINIKFGVVQTRKFHPHPVLLAPGTENDGPCQSCGNKVQSNLMWKCLQCNFAYHFYDCKYYKHPRKNPPIGIVTFGKNKDVVEYQPQTNVQFYPSEMMRPVTRHWKVVDDDLKQ